MIQVGPVLGAATRNFGIGVSVGLGAGVGVGVGLGVGLGVGVGVGVGDTELPSSSAPASQAVSLDGCGLFCPSISVVAQKPSGTRAKATEVFWMCRSKLAALTNLSGFSIASCAPQLFVKPEPKVVTTL